MLFNAIPRIDVKPLAKALLATFGDLNGVVAASEHRLLQVPGTTPKVYLQLKVVEAVAHRMARAQVMERSVISSWEALMTYCRTVMAYRDTEQFRILFLDRKNVLIADEAQAKGTVDHVPVYPARGGEARARAQRRARSSSSTTIPSGDPTPSQADISMTEQIDMACGGDRRRRPRPRGDRKGGGGLVQEFRASLTASAAPASGLRPSTRLEVASSSPAGSRGSCASRPAASPASVIAQTATETQTIACEIVLSGGKSAASDSRRLTREYMPSGKTRLQSIGV